LEAGDRWRANPAPGLQRKVGPQSWFETEENLWQAYQLANRLWSISSAIKYKTQIQQIAEMREEYATAIPGLLQEFLEANR
jgi:23S rRNA G2445 N2-methylase RlmL